MVPIVGKPHRLSFIQHLVSEFSGHFHMPALMLMRWHVRLWNHMSEENACGGKSHSSAISRISEWWQMRIIPHDKFSDKLGKIHEQNITKHTHHHHRHQHQHQVVYFMCVRPMNEKPKRIKKHTEHRCTDGWMDEWLEQHDQQSKAKQSNERDRNSI